MLFNNPQSKNWGFFHLYLSKKNLYLDKNIKIMSKIKILVIPPDKTGVGKFRMSNPFIYLQENYSDEFHIDIKYDIPNNDDEFNDYQIVVTHSFIHGTLDINQNIKRVEWLKNKGVIVIIDTDDYWDLDMRHPMFIYAKQSKVTENRIKWLKSASYITTTTPFFKNTIIKKLNFKDVEVFPNAIDDEESQFQPKPTKSDRLRFGWLGGSSHEYDINLLESGIHTTLNQFSDKTQFVLCGFDLRGKIREYNKENGQVNERDLRPEETVWYRYENVFTKRYTALDDDYVKYLKLYKEIEYNDLDKPYRRIWTRPVNTYANNYNNFDVSLSPLVESLFNNNKSQLKVIEAGFHKKALIASETNPYTIDLINAYGHGGEYNDKGNALLVSPSKNHKDWGKHMVRLIKNPNLVEDLGEKLYETVKDTYSLKNVTKDRAEWLKSLIK